MQFGFSCGAFKIAGVRDHLGVLEFKDGLFTHVQVTTAGCELHSCRAKRAQDERRR